MGERGELRGRLEKDEEADEEEEVPIVGRLGAMKDWEGEE